MGRRGWLPLVIGVSVLLVVASCGGDDTPEPSTTPGKEARVKSPPQGVAGSTAGWRGTESGLLVDFRDGSSILLDSDDVTIELTVTSESEVAGWTVVDAIVRRFEFKVAEGLPEAAVQALVKHGKSLTGLELQLKHKLEDGSRMTLTYQHPEDQQWTAEETFEPAR